MMKAEISTMTNRELYVAYEENDRRYEVLAEMAKRIHRTMITPDVLPIFMQYKLNGAGDERW